MVAMAIQVMKSDEARTRWRDVLDTATAGETDIVIERHGKPTATIVNYEQYLQAKAILEELRTIQEADKLVQKWLENPEHGRPYAEIRKMLVNEGLLDE
jgi:prevent-host-death family protein